jgi:hypothetical protein
LGQASQQRADDGLGLIWVHKQALAERHEGVFDIGHDHHLRLLQRRADVVEVDFLVVRHEADLGAWRYPPLDFPVLVPLLVILDPVQRAQDAVAEGLEEPLVEGLLGHVDYKEIAHANGFPGPVLLRHDEVDCSPGELWPLVTVNADALRAGGTEILRRRVVCVAAQVADKLVAAGTEHHEGVDIGAASVAARRANVTKVQNGNLELAGLERGHRLENKTEG